MGGEKQSMTETLNYPIIIQVGGWSGSTSLQCEGGTVPPPTLLFAPIRQDQRYRRAQCADSRGAFLSLAPPRESRHSICRPKTRHGGDTLEAGWPSDCIGGRFRQLYLVENSTLLLRREHLDCKSAQPREDKEARVKLRKVGSP